MTNDYFFKRNPEKCKHKKVKLGERGKKIYERQSLKTEPIPHSMIAFFFISQNEQMSFWEIACIKCGTVLGKTSFKNINNSSQAVANRQKVERLRLEYMKED